jgi:hypothetical protein
MLFACSPAFALSAVLRILIVEAQKREQRAWSVIRLAYRD